MQPTHINAARMKREQLDEYTDILSTFWAYGMVIVVTLTIVFAVAATWPAFIEYQYEENRRVD